MIPSIRIALADDHQLVRSGIVSILNNQPEFLVVQEAANGRELLDGLAASRPHVILLDLEMPVLSGREALEELRQSNTDIRVLVLTMHQNNAFIVQMMELGANGYLAKDTEPQEVVHAIKKVMEQEYYFSDPVSRAMLSGLQNPAVAGTMAVPSHGLNEREVAVLRAICEEKTTTEIAETLFLSPKTIEGYRKTLMEKTGARNMAGLVLFAVRQGLIE